MTTVVRIDVNGAYSVLTLGAGTATDLATLQEAVGGYVEYVSLGGGFSVLCNEDGRMEDAQDNIPAALAVRVLGPWLVGSELLFTGPVVLAGSASEDGELLGLSERTLGQVTAELDAYRATQH